ncbi:hypothetical protein Poly59_00150 [Rubripirellula reticaptiva]|uniref:Uncharacterized protein n=1 Tax=Rubripirellula reticaptiva TaxID=2528013 RepID=A0A5C6F978_9BACT|nr:hypothetical protein Poly59_00150 [Rubripirellula reticaptiva]
MNTNQQITVSVQQFVDHTVADILSTQSRNDTTRNVLREC